MSNTQAVKEYRKRNPEKVKAWNHAYYIAHSMPEIRRHRQLRERWKPNRLISDEQFEDNLERILETYNEILQEKKYNGLRNNLQAETQVN